jgi:hypothetical protein
VSTCPNTTHAQTREKRSTALLAGGVTTSQNSDFSFLFPLRISAMLGPGLQQEGDLPSPSCHFISLAGSHLAGVIATQTLWLLGSLEKRSPFLYADNQSKEKHLQGYLKEAQEN